MESNENSLSAIEALDSISFKVGLKGYNVDEVDEFFDRLTVEVHQLKDLVAQQRQQLRQAAERINQLDARPAAASPSGPSAVPAPAPAPRAVSGAGAEQVTSMIAMAQQFIEQAQHEAEEKARELTTAAQERAREIITEARSRAEDEVNRLNGLKQRLSEDVETLNRQLDTERARLSGVLAEFSRWVESSLQPGGARPAPTTQPSAPSAPSVQSERPATPPPAPAPTNAPTIGQTLNFGQDLDDSRN